MGTELYVENNVKGMLNILSLPLVLQIYNTRLQEEQPLCYDH